MNIWRDAANTPDETNARGNTDFVSFAGCELSRAGTQPTQPDPRLGILSAKSLGP